MAFAAPAAAGELALTAELAPWGRALYVPLWAELTVGRRGREEAHLFAGETPSRFYNGFRLAPDGSLDGVLERAFFPVSAYVGRSCPPQEFAQLAEVLPRRRGVDRKAIPVAEGRRRGRWVGFGVTADTEGLTARYHCFDAAYELEETDMPPAPDERPPPAKARPENEENANDRAAIRLLPAYSGARGDLRAADAPPRRIEPYDHHR